MGLGSTSISLVLEVVLPQCVEQTDWPAYKSKGRYLLIHVTFSSEKSFSMHHNEKAFLPVYVGCCVTALTSF